MTHSTTAARLAVTASGARALDELLPRLADIPEESIVRPHTDPHAAAVTALLVADYLAQPEFAGRLAQVGLDARAPRELTRAARAIMTTVATLGGDYLSDARAIPPEIEARGQTVRASTIKELEKALPYNREVKMWLEAVRRGSGIVDLVYDLRTLAELLNVHTGSMPAALDELPVMLRAASDAIEYALRADEAPALTITRGRLARVWTLFVPAYERAASAARVLSRDAGAERIFPPLGLVAAQQRARRRPAERREVPPPAALETGSRRAHRAVLELEVGIGSESNFYVGFTENLSSAGFFVATYLMQPIGSKVEIVVTMPDSETLRIRGAVKWQRAASEDGWPGIGVQFDALSKEQEARIRAFLAVREPLFYAD
jgi:uncharacterized protein (TIGR02266 family)